MQNCCKGDSRCQRKTPTLDHQGSKTTEPIDIKLDRGDYIGDLTPHANFSISTIKGAGLHMHEIVIIRVYFLNPRYSFTILCTCTDRIVCPIFVIYCSKDVFSRHLRPWGVNNFLYFPLFFAKIEKITMVNIGKTFK